ncbi:hypothetical protein Taro_005662 [Colocasia esculenta]|uniref:Uncharacterized protein n=1 Tax=Colocasia esculenta TaxID=4460 RepID=A0A843TQH2_COLES|nr:hypothetical protein [Colocasia esculenta]
MHGGFKDRGQGSSDHRDVRHLRRKQPCCRPWLGLLRRVLLVRGGVYCGLPRRLVPWASAAVWRVPWGFSSVASSVGVVYQLVEACGSMRCFLKGSSDGPLIQFTHHSEDTNDPGDGGGIAVFTFWPLPYFEKLAKELVGMYVLELSFKVYLTAWISDVNIDMKRAGLGPPNISASTPFISTAQLCLLLSVVEIGCPFDEILSMVEEEMKVKIS